MVSMIQSTQQNVAFPARFQLGPAENDLKVNRNAEIDQSALPKHSGMFFCIEIFKYAIQKAQSAKSFRKRA